MFTGIVRKTGKIAKIEKIKGKIYFIISVKNFLRGTKRGDSVACDGVCLTIIKKTKDKFIVELMPETLRRTRFKEAKTGDIINLELPLKIGERINGHFVMGHVDGVGVVEKIIKEGDYVSLVIKAPLHINKYLAFKGSAAVNGVSLTIAGPSTSLRTGGNNRFKVCLISHTLKMTNLSCLKKGDRVNIEVDMLARYLEKLLRK